MSPIKRMTSAFSSAGDRSSRVPGGDMPLQNLKSLYAESPDLPIFTRAVSPCPPRLPPAKPPLPGLLPLLHVGLPERLIRSAKVAAFAGLEPTMARVAALSLAAGTARIGRTVGQALVKPTVGVSHCGRCRSSPPSSSCPSHDPVPVGKDLLNVFAVHRLIVRQ